jgi:TRAP-type C4-dicarboxylate transport system permease large subunit
MHIRNLETFHWLAAVGSLIAVEIAQITPPIGFRLFVLQGMTGRDIDFIARAAAPMFLIMLAGIVLLVMFPGIATFLPANI